MNPPRILLIEDNAASLELMTYLLTAFAFDVRMASDGRTGLHLARREHPDLIVCDIQLPGMDGLAVAGALKSSEETAVIPLVAVTAFAMVGDRDRILAAGFDGYIPKPIDPEAFIATIRAHLPAEFGPGS